VVEQEYNPTISDAVKVNVVPQVAPPTVVKQKALYDVNAPLVADVPAGIMPVYAGAATQQQRPLGFARLGYGNNGNLDAAAAIDWRSPDKNDRINARFLLDGMNGNLNIYDENIAQQMGRDKWGAYHYLTAVNVDYAHIFSKVTLTAGGHYHLRNFNYLAYAQAMRNKFSAGDVHAEVRSNTADPRIGYRIGIAYRSYDRAHIGDIGELGQTDGNDGVDEHHWIIDGGISFRLSEQQRVGMDVNMRLTSSNIERREALDLTPYYLFRKGQWNVRAGLHIGMASRGGQDYSFAPDVLAEYRVAKSYLIYVQAKGGRVFNDMSRLEQLSPYGNMSLRKNGDSGQIQLPGYSYEKVNAAIGFKGSPTDGLWFNLYAGVQRWYQDMLLQLQIATLPGISSVPGEGENHVSRTWFEQDDTENSYLGAELRYDYKQRFTLTANARYRQWSISGKKEEADARAYLLSFKPKLELNIQAELRPIPALQLHAGYRRITRNNSMLRAQSSDIIDIRGYNYNAVANLYAGGSYQFMPALSLYARLDNLLNQHYSYSPGYPAQGFAVLGGVRYEF
jgi:hypothetical protein